MSKSPNKNKGSITDAELLLNSKIVNVLNETEQFSGVVIDSIFFRLRRHMADLIISASSNARLSGYDEKIYEKYESLLTYYSKTAAKYDEFIQLIISPKIKKILDGIYSVIKPELKNREDNFALSQNPIFLEKKSIVSKSLNFFAKGIESTLESFYERNLQNCRHEAQKLLISGIADSLWKQNQEQELIILNLYIKFVLNEMNRDCFSSLNKFHAASIRYSVSNINDLDARIATSYYYEQLIKEYEVLSSIIKIQVAAIERERAYSSDEQQAVESILVYLREGYQFLSRDIDEIKECFNLQENQNANFDDHKYEMLPDSENAIDKIEFTTEIYASNRYKVTVGSFYKNVSELLEPLYEQIGCGINDELFNRHIRRKIYELNIGVSNALNMALEMVGAFKSIISFYESTADMYPNSSSLEIIKGIAETVSIKIECLDENRIAYSEKCNDLISEIKNKQIAIDSADIEAGLKNFLIELLKVNGDKDEINYAGVFRKLIPTIYLELLANYSSKAEKMIHEYENYLRKTDFEFKKDYLLYEVSTFEEVLNYSVSRLAEDSEPQVAAFVENIYNCVAVVETILKKNSINKIKPEPHEIFNSKEHEVLMVENSQEFTKGEIIKLLNSGYRQNDVVIIRANVIAAK